MAVGLWNPCPFVVGDATPPIRAIYNGLRSAVGGDVGGAGPSVEAGGIEDARRYATAAIIAAAASIQDAAIAEFNPGTANYWLRTWERILGVPRQDEEQDAREASLAAFAAKVRVDVPHLRDALREKFSSTIDLIDVTREKQAVTMAHRAYADRTGVVAYGARRSAVAPAYSTAWYFHVLWPGSRTADEILLISRYLSKALPSWCNFQIIGQTSWVVGSGILGQAAVD